MINKIRKLINEIHYEDKFSKHFSQFINDYKDKISDKSLFVTFTMHKSNLDDKTFNPNPSTHDDPVGIYGYPLEYVINHPMDIKFAEKRKYLQVLKLNTNKILDLQNVSLLELQRCYNEIYGFDQYITNKKITFNTPRLRGWLLYHLVQTDKLTSTLRTPREQSELFKKLGYEVVMDNAKTENDAIINPNEPEQTIFLTRNSFNIVDFYQHYMTDKWNTFGKVAEKLSGILAQKLGVSITHKMFIDDEDNEYESINDVHENINIEKLLIDYSDGSELNIETRLTGSVVHRDYKESDEHKIYLDYRTYDDVQTKQVYPSSMKVEDIVTNFLQRLTK